MPERGLQPTSSPAEPILPAIYRELARFPSLEHLSRLSRWLDDWIRIPGTSWRIGLDGLVGLIPGVGDTVMFLVSGVVLAAAVRHRLPMGLILRMLGNLGLDLLVGAVPVAGDLFDFVWKANRKNLRLMLDYVKSRGHG